MLIEKTDKKTPTTQIVSYRINIKLMKEFRTLCKQHNVQQTTVIKNAIKQAIKEMKGLSNAK